MKKIFAIALALVMVLSMASAFASYCTGGFDWTCATSTKYCGQGTVEVVPYVKVNNGCGGFKWEVSECASAVSSEDVFYAVKLTVDANADDEWWNTVKITTSYKGMDLPDGTSLTLFNMNKSWKAVKKLITAEDTEASANTFYYDFESKSWDIVNSTFELANSNVDNVPVKDASKAKVCVTLKAENAFTAGIVGNFYVEYTPKAKVIKAEVTRGMIVDALTAEEYELYSGNPVAEPVKPVKTSGMSNSDYKTALAQYEKDYAKYEEYVEEYVAVMDKVAALEEVVETQDYLEVYTLNSGKKDKLLARYVIVDGKVYDIITWSVCGYTYADVEAFFGLKIGTCVDAKLIKANFGWKDKVEDCFAWGDKAPYVVDAECVVAIPKTGDASVLAWLF